MIRATVIAISAGMLLPAAAFACPAHTAATEPAVQTAQATTDLSAKQAAPANPAAKAQVEVTGTSPQK